MKLSGNENRECSQKTELGVGSPGAIAVGCPTDGIISRFFPKGKQG